MHKALYFEKRNEKLRCLLCPHHCLLAEGETGICGVRKAVDEVLYTMNYGLLAAVNLDPIEKKPLYHYHPGRPILSIGTYGCNLLCSFCQNWSLARGKADDRSERVKPEDVLDMLKREGGPAQNIGIAYTYNEPSIWYEFVLDTAKLLNRHGYKNILVTNGYINQEPLRELLPYIDAMNIDVKAFGDSFYKDYCGGLKAPVIKTVEIAVKGCHVEITSLIIPTLNDNPGELEAMAAWLAELNPDIPLHLSRYFPQYRLNLPPTPHAVMEEAKKIASKHLRYVYLGNIELPGSGNTICPYCGNLLIERSRYAVKMKGLDGSACSNCNNNISIVLS